jgi:FkbM family methyltransferase
MAYVERASYLRSHFGLTHRVRASISRMLDGHTYTIRHGLAKGLKRKGGLGFIPSWLAAGVDSTPEVRLFTSLNLSGRTVFDIGGMQGLCTLFFATRARTVVVYEPNPASRQRLEDNVRLNRLSNVVVRPVGLGSSAREVELVFDPRMIGGASANDLISRQIRETSPNSRTERIQVVRLDDDVIGQQLPAPDFVKIDVEGMELEVLQGMREVLRRSRPKLYIEMHGATADDKRANARRVVEELSANGYTMTHVESGAPVSLVTSERAAEGHLFCSPT